MNPDRQRIDKWLWHARAVRTRADAAALANAGRVRINGDRINAAGRGIKRGDVVTVSLDSRVRVWRVLDFAERRGGAPEAQALYEDLTPPPPPQDDAAAPNPAAGPMPARDAGAGRPSKRERRELDRWRQPDEE